VGNNLSAETKHSNWARVMWAGKNNQAEYLPRVSPKA